MADKILSGLRVIDFGQYIPGPLTAMMLADYGADVIHIDPPGGPLFDDPINAVLMRGKRNISLDLKTPAGLDTARRLIASADVVVENFRPGVMERLGVGPKSSMAGRTDLIYCSVPGFAACDKRAGVRGWEGIVTAEAGMYQISRFEAEKGVPHFNALPLASVFGAVIAAHSIAAALIVREKTGRGQYIEAPLYDACFEYAGIFGADPKRKPPMPAKPDPRTSFRDLSGYECKDGRYIQLSPPKSGTTRLWNYFAPDFDLEDKAGFKAMMTAKFKEKTMLEWERFIQDELRAGGAPILTSAEWLHDAYAMSSRSVVEVDDPKLGATRQPGPAVYMSRTPAELKPRTLPDADRESILRELETIKRTPRPVKGNTELHQALEGVRVLDLCQVLAGPISARILAEYGAKVIKINNPRTFENPTAMAGHETVNCGKATAFIDLKSEEGKALFKELLSTADVFHCNFTQEATERLGLGEEELRRIKPDLIFSQVNLHSLGGFREYYRGHEELGEAVSGMEERLGGGPKGATLPITVCDNSTGCISAFGVLLALYHREKTGEGQRVQAALSRSGGYLQIPYMIDYDGKVWNEPRGQKHQGWSVFERLYSCSEGWIFLSARGRESALCALLGLDMSAPGLEQRLEASFASAPAAEWVGRLAEADVTAVVSRDFGDDAMEEPYAKARGLSVRRDHPGIGETRVIGCAPRLSLTPAVPAFPSAQKGFDTEAVKAEKWLWTRK